MCYCEKFLKHNMNDKLFYFFRLSDVVRNYSVFKILKYFGVNADLSILR